MYSHLLFDFDGTLIDSSAGILKSFEAALKKFGMSPTVPLEKSLIGPPLQEVLRRISDSADARQIERLTDAFKEDYDTDGYQKTSAYAGTDSALRKLHARGAKLLIVTNKRILPTKRILTHLGWDMLFAGVFALDSTDPPVKNKAALIRNMLERKVIAAEKAIMIGDTPDDYHAARDNGMNFAAVSWGYGRFDAAVLADAGLLRSPAEFALL